MNEEFERALQRLSELLAEASAAVTRLSVLARRDGEGALREEPAASAPSPEGADDPAPPPRPAAWIPPRQGEPVEALAEEIDQARPFLPDLGRRERTRQIAVWAGRARALQESIPEGDPRRPALRAVFGRLTAITRETPCDWVDALDASFTADWDAYVGHFRGQELPREKEQSVARALLQGLMSPRRRVTAFAAQTAILEALQFLPEDDPALAEAFRRFGRPGNGRPAAERAEAPPSPEAEADEKPPAVIPPEVLAVTRGRRALVAGGQGARENHRRAIQTALQLRELDWVTSERDQASVFDRLAERIHPGRYDIVFYLAAYTSHKGGNHVISAARDSGVSLVYLKAGYGVSQIVHAVGEQLVERKHEPEPEPEPAAEAGPA